MSWNRIVRVAAALLVSAAVAAPAIYASVDLPQVRVGGNIKEPKKIKDVKPVYPEAAKAAGVQGIVIIETLIGTDGAVNEAKVLRSVPDLDKAAIDAVMQWKYTPTLLNGEAVAVIMTVTVTFSLQYGPGRGHHVRMSFAIDMLDRAYNRRSWHGTNLRGSLRGLTFQDAARRPSAGRHNIWELVVHCAYWKYAVTRRLTGMKRGSFPFDGSNFFERPVKGGMTERAWKADIALLDESHRALRAAIVRIPPPAFLVQGIAAHDLYHAGQIQLIKENHMSGHASKELFT